MPRVPVPKPFIIREALTRIGITFDGSRGYIARHRIYDRTSGNFKASGWMVGVRDATGAEIRIAIPDEYFPVYYQGTL